MLPDPTSTALARQARAAQAKRQRQRKKPRATNVAKNTAVLSPTQKTGQTVETLAAIFLQQQGLTVLARNLNCPLGELDLVVKDRDTLVFVEVRYRRSTHFGGAPASITLHKQQRLLRAAHWFLPRLTARYFNGRTPPCRFDVISYDTQGRQWLRNAFVQETN